MGLLENETESLPPADRLAAALRDGSRRFVSGFPVWEASILVGYVALRLLSSFGKNPGIFNDTPEYLHFRGFSTPRPWTVPILFGAFGRHRAGIIVAQVLIGCAAWVLLAHTVATTLRRHCGTVVQVVMVSAVLAVALSVRVAEWDYQLLSESLSISLLVVFVALVVRFDEAPRARRAIGVAAGGAFWMQTRDSNTIIFAFVVAAVGIAGFVPWRRRTEPATRPFRLLVLVSGIAVVLSLTLTSHTNGQPYLQPAPSGAQYQRVTATNLRLMDTFGKRVFHDPKAVAFFEKHGMPPSAATQFVDFAGADQNFKMYTDVGFVKWVNQRGLGTYALWLASNPWKTVRTPFRSATDLFSPGLDNYFVGARHYLPPVIEDLVWPAQPGRVVMAVLLAFGAAVVTAWRRGRRGLLRSDGGIALFSGTSLGISAVVALILTWQLEWLEVARHNVTNTIALRIAVIQLIVAAFVFNSERDRPPESVTPDADAVGDDMPTPDATRGLDGG